LDHGFEVIQLPGADLGQVTAAPNDESGLERTGWYEDSEATVAAIASLGYRPDWLIVDHYSLDSRWERAVRHAVRSIMVIDDLADRPHDCDLLLDQNFESARHPFYAELIPGSARQLLGTRYALVRPEFRRLRQAALARRNGEVGRVLVSMGGTDPQNDTAKAISGIAMGSKSRLAVDVVIGSGNPHREEIRDLCSSMYNATLHVQTNRMAELMTAADVAINGGGSTTWERCVLGLPGLVAIQSPDQTAVAQGVARRGGQIVLGEARELLAQDYARALDGFVRNDLVHMSQVAADLCDGEGTARVVAELMN